MDLRDVVVDVPVSCGGLGLMSLWMCGAYSHAAICALCFETWLAIGPLTDGCWWYG